MKWIWRGVALIAFLVMLYSCALPGDLPVGQSNTDGLAGTYTINGIDPTGFDYSGTVVISSTDQPDVFEMDWIVTGSLVHGVATQTGSELDVVWETTSAVAAGSGTANYVIQPDGRLVGTRNIVGFDSPGSEEIFPEP
jgi:hypothetical protein